MKLHTPEFKQNIKTLGRELDSKISYVINNETIELGNEQLNSISLHYEGNLLKSIMKQLDVDSNIEIPVGTEINYQFGIKVGDEYEYLDYGNFIVMKIEKKEDTKSWQIKCYDKMLFSMKNYEQMGIEYPVTVKNYIIALCDFLGLEFKNVEETFVNYDKVINRELYLNANEQDIGFTFRDVLDQLAEVTASIICINNNDQLEIRYINDTNDIIDEEYFKNTNVQFGEKFGPVNSIVLARAADSDKIYLKDDESIEQNGLTEIKISENQIMNFNNRDEFLPEILNELNGLEYYINDYSSTGVCYYEVADKYNVSIGENIYPCIMLNDEINVTQGLEENIHAEKYGETNTDYTKADKTDRKINQTTLIVNKQEQYIEGLITDMYEEDGKINNNFTRIYQNINSVVNEIQNTSGSNLLKNSVMFAYNDRGVPDEWEVNIQPIQSNNENDVVYGNLEGLSIQSDTEALNAGSLSAHSFTLNNQTVRQRVVVQINSNEQNKKYYTFNTKIKKNAVGTCYVKIYNANEEYKIELLEGESAYYSDYSITAMLPTLNYFIVEFYGSEGSDATFTDNMLSNGEYVSQWSQASGEIMNTQVNLNINGILVKSAQYVGNYTVMSPLEFAGYAMINDVMTKVFTLNNDTTEVEKLKVKKQILMSPIKIVPITTGDMQGWAFVEMEGDD